MPDVNNHRTKRVNGTKIYELNRSLYGLREANRLFYELCHTTLAEIGFQRLPHNLCIYAKHLFTEQEVVVACYVDDTLIFTNSEQSLRELKEQLSSKLDITDMGEARYFLGVAITRDRTAGTISLSQQQSITDLAAEFLGEHLTPTKTPNTPNTTLHKHPHDQTPPQPLDSEHITQYKSLVGHLNHIARMTRPDVAETVSQLSRYLAAPCQHHLQAAKQALRYLHTTREHALTYHANSTNDITAYADANFAGDQSTTKSTTGYLIMSGGAAVSWASRLQKSIAQSTTEAELVATTNCANHASYILDLAQDLGSQQTTITLYNDNTACHTIANDPLERRNTRHIHIRHMKIQEYTQDGTAQSSLSGYQVTTCTQTH